MWLFRAEMGRESGDHRIISKNGSYSKAVKSAISMATKMGARVLYVLP